VAYSKVCTVSFGFAWGSGARVFPVSRFTRAANVLETNNDCTEYTIAQKLLLVFNGDWRNPWLEHYHWLDDCPCGGTPEKCAEMCVALVQSVVFERVMEEVPSSSRWHTVAPALEAQGLGLLLHNILGRVSDAAANKSNAVSLPEYVDPVEDATLAFRAYNAAKDRKASTFLGSPDSQMTVALACAISEPVDHLMARLQRLDHEGHGFTELLTSGGRRRGLLTDCQFDLWALGHPGMDSRLNDRFGQPQRFSRSRATCSTPTSY
jgi:hypothetical protein